MYSLRHIGIYVENLQQMKFFYQETFHLKEESGGIESGHYIETVLDLPGAELVVSKLRFEEGGLLELIQVKNPVCSGRNTCSKLWSPGQSHIAIQVEDMETVYAIIRKKNLNCLSEPAMSSNGFAKVCFCQDPEGNFLELVEVLK